MEQSSVFRHRRETYKRLLKTVTAGLVLLFAMSSFVYSQEVTNRGYYPDRPVHFIPRNHTASMTTYERHSYRSFYQSKSDWRHIIDSTWGPGDPLSQKLLIYNSFAQRVHDEFDGFTSLQLNWDSLYAYYLDRIIDSTSRGAFSSLMSHFAYDLKDMHTRAYDSTVVFTPLNPGVPILLMGSYISVEHFGAITTVLPDSTTLVLRVVPNHPLDLQPGDIILGYEGIPWKDLVRELFDAGLPMVAYTGGCNTADTYLNLFGVGVNWHLFDTIDIVKHFTGDTLHLSVLPLMGLHIPTMFNNEQLSMPTIPFPDLTLGQCATYGILPNTNIGYIYLAQEWPENTADAQLYQAVHSLRNTDALIIDMRLNFGGWALFDNAFGVLFNDCYSTIGDAYRCSNSTFELCPSGDQNLFNINGIPPSYERPMAVLLGPTCVSMGDLTAQRLKYHPMVKFFGKSSDATLGDNLLMEHFPGWYIRYSISDMYHTDSPGSYLNRREFPIDEEVWLTRDGVANGEDAVVQKALTWMQSLSYAHDVNVSWSDSVAIAPAVAGVMYAASDSLYTIDTQSGAITTIGWIGPNSVDGMAIRTSTREIYAVSATSLNTGLYRISASGTGQLAAAILEESIRITAKVENPGQHILVVSAIVTDGQGAMVDSVILTNVPGDSIWGAAIAAPATAGRYDVSVRTEDLTAGTYRRLPKAAWFSSLTRIERTLPIPSMGAIAFGCGDTLYGATTSGGLYRIDLNAGRIDSLGTTHGLVYSGLSFRPRTQELWASVRYPLDSIFTLNTNTGAATFVGTTEFTALTTSIAFNPTGLLFGLIDDGSGADYLATIDTISATGSIIAGPLSASHLQAIATLTDTVATSVEENPNGDIPCSYSLGQNYPNPFNPSTTISYQLPKQSHVMMRIFDILGREVATLVNEVKHPGVYTVQFDGSGLASGVYFYQLKAENFVETRRLLLLR